MKAWKRAATEFQCGSCPAKVPAGQPLLLIQPSGLSHPKKRCEKCAGEPVPAYLPGEDEADVPAMTRIGSVPLPFDRTARQVGSE